jgi:hypothetical protein
MRTVTYATLKSRFTSAIGVDSLLTAEETAFKNSLNDRVQGAWTRSKWPELTDVVEKSVAAVADPPFDKAVQIDAAADLYDVFSVWNKNPYTERAAVQRAFSLINGYLVLPADNSDTSIFVVGSLVPADDYGDGTTTLPAFLSQYLLAASVADWYRADGQNDKAAAEDARAENYLLEEIDRAERLESQNRIVITQYQAPWPTLLVTQTTV